MAISAVVTGIPTSLSWTHTIAFILVRGNPTIDSKAWWKCLPVLNELSHLFGEERSASAYVMVWIVCNAATSFYSLLQFSWYFSCGTAVLAWLCFKRDLWSALSSKMVCAGIHCNIEQNSRYTEQTERNSLNKYLFLILVCSSHAFIKLDFHVRHGNLSNVVLHNNMILRWVVHKWYAICHLCTRPLRSSVVNVENQNF